MSEAINEGVELEVGKGNGCRAEWKDQPPLSAIGHVDDKFKRYARISYNLSDKLRLSEHGGEYTVCYLMK